MKVGTVKKMIMLAEGFGYNDSLEAFYDQGSIWIHFKYIRQWEFYPILLYRAAWGWNEKNEPYDIDLQNIGILYCGKGDYELDYNYSDYPKTEYLTSQERTIEACLIELLEK